MFFFFLSSLFIFFIAQNIYDYLYITDLPWREGDFKAIILNCVFGSAVFAIIGIGIWVWIRINRKREIKNGRNQTGI